MRGLGLAGLLLMTACIMEPKLDDWGVPYDPPTIYATWWAEVEACSGLHGELKRVTWLYYPDTMAVGFNTPWGWTDGIYSAHEHSVMVVRARIDQRRTIAHEMLHALLRRGGHPPVFAACGL